MSAVITPLVEVPVGTVPPLRDFLKHVWRYRDAAGETVLVAPPGNVFTLVLDDHDEANVAITVAGVMATSLGYESRIRAVFAGPNVLVEFRDLHAVHMFLQVLSLHSDRLPAREVATYCLAMLGFRWM
jgi:hypothetical protein